MRRNISGYAYKVAKSMMPKISDTERAALNAGTGKLRVNAYYLRASWRL
jgi:hypothetical protein